MNRDFRNTAIWMICATGIVLMAYWQAQVAVARETAERHKTLTPPVKTKRAVRLSVIPQPAKDPVASYATLKKKGIADREISWIVEDFQNAGLNLGLRSATPEDFLLERQKQDQWYHDALVEAWSLTPEQSAEATAKLRELYLADRNRFSQEMEGASKPIEIEGKTYRIINGMVIERLINAQERLLAEDSLYFPWRLCSIPPPDSPSPSENDSSAATSDNHFQLPEIRSITRLMPSTGVAAEETSDEGFIQQLHRLHPAEFKILLLIHPDLCKKIQQALEPQIPFKASERKN